MRTADLRRVSRELGVTAGARSYLCYTKPGLFRGLSRNGVRAETSPIPHGGNRIWPDCGRPDPQKPLHNCIKRNRFGTIGVPNGYQFGTGLEDIVLHRYNLSR